MTDSVSSKNDSSSNLPNPYNDPYYISGSDNPSNSIVNPLFNGKNFLRWSRGIKRALGTKNKLGFIDGTMKEPDENHVDYQAWHRCNFLVSSWLINSIIPELAEDFNYFEFGCEIWTEIRNRYANINGPLIYQLKKEINALRQENLELTAYYSKLQRSWDELHNVRKIPTCTCGALAKCTCEYLKRLTGFDDEEKLFQFLLGLNAIFDNTVSNILTMRPLPNLSDAYNIVSQVDKQKEVSGQNECVQEAVAMAVHREYKPKTYDVGKRDWKKEKASRFCDHCKMKGHTKDQCFKLIGVPDWYHTLKQSKQSTGRSNGQRFHSANTL